MTERPTGRVAGALAFGLLLGIAGGWLAGLVRVPPASESRPPESRPPEPGR